MSSAELGAEGGQVCKPFAGELPPWGSDDDRVALITELLAAGQPGRAWWIAGGIADAARRAELLAATATLMRAEAEALNRAALQLLAGELVAEALASVPAPAPGLDLAALLAEGLDTLGQLLDPATGELRRVRVDADVLRAWVAERAPGLDTTAIEQLLPQVRAERRRRRAAGEWAADRAKVRALGDAQLLSLCKRRAGRHAAAVKQSDPRAAYYGALAAVADGERRRRGLDLAALDAEALGQRPRKARRQSFAERRELQQGQAERRAHLLDLFDARAHDAVTTAPAAPAYLDMPADDVPHPAGDAPAVAPATPSAGSQLAERLRVVTTRPRVTIGHSAPQVEALPARASGYSAAECDAWLLANGWRRGPAGEWVVPAAAAGKVAPCAD